MIVTRAKRPRIKSGALRGLTVPPIRGSLDSQNSTGFRIFRGAHVSLRGAQRRGNPLQQGTRTVNTLASRAGVAIPPSGHVIPTNTPSP